MLLKGWEIGALNPNSVLCTDQAPSPAFSALNPGSALNPRTLNPGTTVFDLRHEEVSRLNVKGSIEGSYI